MFRPPGREVGCQAGSSTKLAETPHPALSLLRDGHPPPPAPQGREVKAVSRVVFMLAVTLFHIQDYSARWPLLRKIPPIG